MSAVDIALIVGAFVLILVGAEVFTNGVEWLGIKLRISEGATGSILAAIGTATPETLIPVVAILFTNTPDADEIGVGAILGAPFMLGTLVMLLIGVTAFALRARRKRNTLHVDAPHALRDLSFFLVMYTIALALALIPPEIHYVKSYLGWIFIPAYFLYLFRAPRPRASRSRDPPHPDARWQGSHRAWQRRRGNGLPVDAPGHDRRAAHALAARPVRHGRGGVRAPLRTPHLRAAARSRAGKRPSALVADAGRQPVRRVPRVRSVERSGLT